MISTKSVAIALTLLLLIGVFTPQPAFAQFGGLGAIFSAINSTANSILSYINNIMRPIVDGIRTASAQIQTVLGQMRNLWEQVVWPLREIDRARGLARAAATG